jgi:hypothetical protein
MGSGHGCASRIDWYRCRCRPKLLHTPVKDLYGDSALELRIEIDHSDICIEGAAIPKHDASGESSIRHDYVRFADQISVGHIARQITKMRS